MHTLYDLNKPIKIPKLKLFHINKEHKKSDRTTVIRLDSIVRGSKQNHKSNLILEKYSLLPSQSYSLTPAQTALQQLTEKHPNFEIQPVNTT